MIVWFYEIIYNDFYRILIWIYCLLFKINNLLFRINKLITEKYMLFYKLIHNICHYNISFLKFFELTEFTSVILYFTLIIIIFVPGLRLYYLLNICFHANMRYCNTWISYFVFFNDYVFYYWILHNFILQPYNEYLRQWLRNICYCYELISMIFSCIIYLKLCDWNQSTTNRSENL